MSFDAKSTINKVMLIGRLGQDVELKFTQSGVATAMLNVATNTSYKAQDGNMVENTEWHRVVLWRQQAENAAKYLKKGSRVYVEGKLQTRNWEKDGAKHYTTEIVADSLQFLDSKPTGKSEDDKVVENIEKRNAEPPITENDNLPF
jgi:single-strand DNA-binding protein